MELEININRYINGELKGADLAQFEALLKQDKALQEQVQFHLEVDETLLIHEEVNENHKLKSILGQLGKTHIQNEEEEKFQPTEERERKEIIANPEIFNESEKAFKRINPFLILAAAAAFLLFMLLPSLKNQSNSEIADKQFQVFELSDKTMGVFGDENSEDLYLAARNHYQNRNFAEAKSQFDQYLQANPNVPKVLLAKGCAEFELAEFDEAIESFNQVLIAEESKIYQPNAHWYLALCYLKKDETQKAMNHLKVIMKGQDHFDEATKLLKRLKS